MPNISLSDPFHNLFMMSTDLSLCSFGS